MKKRPTLMNYVVVFLILSLLAVVLLPILRTAMEERNVKECEANLSALMMAHSKYYSVTANSYHPAWAQFRGGEFWLDLANVGAINDPSLLLCPMSGSGTPGQTSYRGPSGSAFTYKSYDPIICDRPGNHGKRVDVDMNWGAKSGDIYRIPADSPEWADVLEKTED